MTTNIFINIKFHVGNFFYNAFTADNVYYQHTEGSLKISVKALISGH